MKIGIIVAMNKEFDLIARECQRKKEEKQITRDQYGVKYMEFKLSHSDELVIMQCGIGKVNATIGAMLLCDMGVDCIISSGVAGSLKKDIIPGVIVVGTEYQYHDVYCGIGNEPGQVQGEPATFNAGMLLLDISHKVAQPGTHHGLIITGDSFIDNKIVAEELSGRNPLALAVDMESGAIAQVCHKREVPFLSYRIISDCILNPAAISYDDFWEEAPHIMAAYTLTYIKSVFDYVREIKT